MKIYLVLTRRMAVDLADYLWQVFSARTQAAQAKRRTYTQDQFAQDMGLKPTTLNSIMNAKGQSKRIAWETLQVLVNYFGDDFTYKVGIVPPEDPPALHWRLEGEGEQEG